MQHGIRLTCLFLAFVFPVRAAATGDTLRAPGKDKFWKATLERLARVPMEPLVEAVSQPLPYRQFKVTLSSLDGARISAWLAIPVQGEAPAKPWPVIISTPGYGGSQQSVMLSECQRGYAILQVFPRGQGESAAAWNGADKLTWKLDSPEGAYYQGAYADVIRMIDFVISRKDLDSTRIALAGTSQGGGISLAVAALDPRVKAVAAHVPFLCNFRVAAATPGSLVRTLLDRARRNDPAALRTLDYFDPLQLAPGLHIPVLISAGGKDSVCPMQTIRSVYERLPGDKLLKVYPDLTHTSCLDFYKLSWTWLSDQLGIDRSVLLQSENLLPNGDFMSRDPQQRPLRWITGNTLQTAVITGEQRHGLNEDDQSLRMADSSLADELLVRSGKSIVGPGTTYRAGAWVKGGSGLPAGLSLEFWDQNNKRIAVRTVHPSFAEEWRYETVSAVSPDKVTHVSVALATEKKDTGVSWWDDISLRYEYLYEPQLNTGDRELFVDDYRIDSMVNVQRVVHPARRSKPLIKPDRPWEGNAAYIYGTVLKDEPAGSGYRMWYTAYLDKKYYLCYATSRDGISWEKPDLSIVEYKGSTHNNICKEGGGTLVHDTAEKDPARRYKLMEVVKADTIRKRPMGYGVFFSKDGWRWTPYEGNPVITYGDVSTVAYDRRKQRFIAATKQRMLVSNTSVTPGKMDRAAFISVSTDFIHWTAPGAPGSDWALAVEGDPADDLAVMAAGGIERQVYGMTVHPYAGMYIGLPWAFDITGYATGIFAGYGDGPIQPQIAASRDLKHWSRPDRTPVLPLGKAGAWDDGTIYSSSNLLVSEKEVTLYYGGMNMPHGGSSATQVQTAQIAKAVWRRDGFVSLYNAGDDPGVITTRPLAFTGRQLKVNASLENEGRLKVEILDASGRPLPGFTFSEADEIRGDQLSAVARWRSDHHVKELAGRKIRLRFHLKGGDLYAYWFSE